MGCLCCCYRNSNGEEPSALVSKDGSPVQSPRKSYGAIPTEDPSPRKTSEPSSPRKSPSELLYSEPLQSARVRSPSPSSLSPTAVSPRQSNENISAQEGQEQKQKKTLAEIAGLAQNTTSAFQPTSPSRSSQSESKRKESNAKSAGGKPGQKMRDPSPVPEVLARQSPSFESDTCHSIGGTTDEDVDEDTEILGSPTPATASMVSAGSETRLVTTTPGSSTLDMSKDPKKPSKAKDFMKKAGKNMKKAKKKVGKGVEKMLKKKEESDTERSDISRERTGSNTTSVSSDNEYPSQGTSSKSTLIVSNKDEPTAATGAPPPRRVTSERMKSKYARAKVAEMEKKREEEASHRAAQGMADPRQAAHERGEKLSELEDKTEQMRDQAAAFAHNVSQLKSRNASSS